MMETLHANACTGFDMCISNRPQHSAPGPVADCFGTTFAFKLRYSNKLFHETIEIWFNITIFSKQLMPFALHSPKLWHFPRRL